jgi:hypothetical protein
MKTVVYGRDFWVFTACLLLIFPLSVQAQIKVPPVPFSADWSAYGDGDDGYAHGGRYFASNEGIRQEATAGDESYVYIVNFSRMVGWSLIELEHRVIEEALDPDLFDHRYLGRFGSPCPTYARATHSGSETLDGRGTEKWICVSPHSGTMTVWYDSRLQAVIRYEDEDGYGELNNIREGAQPASLFILPDGYSNPASSAAGRVVASERGTGQCSYHGFQPVEQSVDDGDSSGTPDTRLLWYTGIDRDGNSIRIELGGSGEPVVTFAPGSTIIGANRNDQNLHTCTSCVLIASNCDAHGRDCDLFFAVSGELVVDQIGSWDGELFVGRLKNMVFQQVTIGRNRVSTPVAEGAVWCVEDMTFSAYLNVECVSNDDCATDTPFCSDEGACVGCVATEQCPNEGEKCLGNTCVVPRPGDSCANPIVITESGIHEGNLAHYTDYFHLSTRVCTGHSVKGPDVVFQVTLDPGQDLKVVYTLMQADGSVYMLEDCLQGVAPVDHEAVCHLGSDEGVANETETLEYTHAEVTPKTFYVVLDSFAAASNPAAAKWTAEFIFDRDVPVRDRVHSDTTAGIVASSCTDRCACTDEVCFQPHFAACATDAAFTTQEVFGARVRYQILGADGDGCRVSLTYLSNPNPRWVERPLLFTLDRTRAFSDEVVDGMTACANEPTSRFHCSGPLREVLRALYQGGGAG